ncbi:MAG: hypothetical protein EOO01_41345 [Chitinophagaceae bacterium]|nr:MAG: hypothetical protein EOO01_41345 [Chitinophagaceae bacterium]
MDAQCSVTGVCEEPVFSSLFKAHARTLRNYLLYKFGNEEKANDLSQDAFMKLWENCENVPPEKAKSFLNGCNCCRSAPSDHRYPRRFAEAFHRAASTGR